VRKERISGRIFRKTVELETEKRAVKFCIRLRKMSGGLSPDQKEKEGYWWYSWTGWHLMRESLEKSDLEKTAAGAVRE
jgi:hypothetical protein